MRGWWGWGVVFEIECRSQSLKGAVLMQACRLLGACHAGLPTCSPCPAWLLNPLPPRSPSLNGPPTNCPATPRPSLLRQPRCWT